jgi:hypothetical protein
LSRDSRKGSNTVVHGVRHHAGMAFHKPQVKGYADGDSVGLFEDKRDLISDVGSNAPQAAEVQASMADNTQAQQAAQAEQSSPGQADQAAANASLAGEQSQPGVPDLDQAAANAGAKAGAFEAIKDKVKAEGMTKNIERGKRFLASMDGPVGEGARSVMAMQESKKKTERARLDDQVSRKAAQDRGVVLREENESFGDQVSRSPVGRALGKMSSVVKDAYREFAPKEKK